MICKLEVSLRYCETLKCKWFMVDSLRELNEEESNSIKDKLMPHKGVSGITWNQEQVHSNGDISIRRTFIKVPDKILEIRDTPLNKTLYIQVKDIPDLLRQAVEHKKAMCDI